MNSEQVWVAPGNCSPHRFIFLFFFRDSWRLISNDDPRAQVLFIDIGCPLSFNCDSIVFYMHSTCPNQISHIFYYIYKYRWLIFPLFSWQVRFIQYTKHFRRFSHLGRSHGINKDVRFYIFFFSHTREREAVHKEFLSLHVLE